MYRTGYIIFALAVAIAIGIIAWLTQDEHGESTRFIGSKRCKTCHETNSSGEQYKIWLNSAHSNAYKSLFSKVAKDFIALKQMDSSNCYKCHTSVSHKPLNEYELKLADDGVSCEACHGAGSRYSTFEIMQDSLAFEMNGGVRGSLEDCYSCHAKDINNKEVCPFQKSNFSAEKEWLKIQHPSTRNRNYLLINNNSIKNNKDTINQKK
jgi:uncharacterized CHY-type Zn-finger protein